MDVGIIKYEIAHFVIEHTLNVSVGLITAFGLLFSLMTSALMSVCLLITDS